MLIPFAIASMSLLPNHFSERNHDVDIFTNLSSISYAENNSAYHLTKGHDVDYHRGESAFTFNEFSIGTKYKNFSLSYIYRYEWFLSFTEDTMEFYGTTVNGTLATANKNYDIDLKTNHINTEGLRLAYQYELNSANLYVAASYLKARELMEGDLTGNVILSGNCGDDFECYTGDLDLSYTYSEDRLLDRVVDAPKSIYGYSFDIGADWQINKEWFTSIYIQDLVSEILWEYAPFTNANATTSRTTIENGKLKIDPVITGHEGNKDYKQTLPIKYNGLVGYSINDKHYAYLQGFYSYNSLIAHLGYQYLNNNSMYRIKLYPLEEAMGLEYKNSFFNVALTTKPFDFEESELVEIRFGLSIQLI